jgi:endonuclease-3 related protein
LRDLLAELLCKWGRQNWWPAESPIELAVSAVLVQNTAWRNVEHSLERFRKSGGFALGRLAALSPDELQGLVRPAGFFRQKTATLQRFFAVLHPFGSLEIFLARPLSEVRSQLLALGGIGPETADSILLYAGAHEIFVVDIYLRRLLALAAFPALATAKYESLREVIEDIVCADEQELLRLLQDLHSRTPRHASSNMSRMARSPRADLYAELHAVIVREGVENRKPAQTAPADVK